MHTYYFPVSHTHIKCFHLLGLDKVTNSYVHAYLRVIYNNIATPLSMYASFIAYIINNK